MFNNFNDNSNYSECIANEFLETLNDEIKELSPPSEASKAVLQFYTDDDGVRILDYAAMPFKPIVAITQNEDKPEQGYKGKGFKIANMGYYKIEGFKNIAQTKFIPFDNKYVVFCFIQYYK